MLYLIYFLLLALRAMAVTLPNVEAGVPSVIRSEGLPEGYTEGPIMWSGFGDYLSGLQGSDGSGKNVKNLQLNGTVQNIYHQLEVLGFPLQPLNETELDAKMNAIEIKGGSATPPTKDISRQCGVGGVDTVSAYDLSAGAAYLGSLGDDMKCSNMGKSCGRISCSYDSAIWWCNDNTNVIEYQCNLFAYYAWEVYYHCSRGDGNDRQCRGQITENGLHFRTLVGRSPDHC
ncbi:hypothetical protein SLS62_011232 [Diatrype stigma]|uniref:Secreted protein n=1 Tax=Diatrype stigma TaxID=117547 RepID=A0AAN9U6U5_9PEZI